MRKAERAVRELMLDEGPSLGSKLPASAKAKIDDLLGGFGPYPVIKFLADKMYDWRGAGEDWGDVMRHLDAAARAAFKKAPHSVSTMTVPD